MFANVFNDDDTDDLYKVFHVFFVSFAYALPCKFFLISQYFRKWITAASLKGFTKSVMCSNGKFLKFKAFYENVLFI